jgi:hypothetical protein
MEQLVLISGLYRCHNCDRDVAQVRKARWFRLCDRCWSEIVAPTRPEHTGPLTDELWQARERYWQWYYRMEERHPAKQNWQKSHQPAQVRSTDSLYPLCECGRRRRVIAIGQPGLFGGPFAQYCHECEGRHTVERLYEMAPRLMPGRDEEDWLDLLYKSHRELFESGILPDYWFELKFAATCP